jgi:hypothetical protein
MLGSMPDVEPPTPSPNRPGSVRLEDKADGSGKAVIELPADDWAIFKEGLLRARDAEYRDLHDLEADAEVPITAAGVTFVDGLLRMTTEALDALDPTFRRTGFRGERNQIVIHRDLLPDGTLGPGRIHGSIVQLPDALNRYMCCDAKVRMAITSSGRLLGITPTERTPNRALRRYLEHRDGGCAHPLCGRRRWVHQHHIVHWEDGGPTIPSNLANSKPDLQARRHPERPRRHSVRCRGGQHSAITMTVASNPQPAT